jgi:AraC-like DNA-binding protein
MAEETIPGDLRDFILRYIDSVGQLEALLLLRAHPNMDWDVKQTAARLYASEVEVADILARLCGDGFLSCREEVYSYARHSPERQDMLDRLAAAYSRHLIQVTNLIHAKPRRIREFADAFKFRKDR